jgi:4-amino-4-deoxy-L-arabinose transferase-like glycosyltransferase
MPTNRYTMIRNILTKPYSRLLLILVLAAFLRGINIAQNPPTMYGDELTAAYDTYSILKTGYDQTGTFLPTTFAMGEGRLAGYIYFSLPFVALFGATELGIRMLSVLSGIGCVLFIYLLGKKLLGQNVGLVSAGLMSISPWSISLSRGGFETHFALMLTLCGIVCFLYARTKYYLVALSGLSFALAIHTYPAYKLTVPLIIVLLLVYQQNYKSYLKNIPKKWLTGFGIFLTIAMVLLVYQILFTSSENRLLRLILFTDNQMREILIQKINFDRSFQKFQIIAIIFHNKVMEYSVLLIHSFFEHLNLNFLFVSGDGNPRHNIGGVGLMYFSEIVTIVLGLKLLFVKQKSIGWVLISIILIGVLPSVLLNQPHALRSSLMLPGFVILSAFGFVSLFERCKSQKVAVVTVLTVLGLLVQFAIFTERLFVLSPFENSQSWSYPAKLASLMANENKTKYNFVILSDQIDNIEYAYPVYAVENPYNVIHQNKFPSMLNGFKFKQYKNIYIGRIPPEDINMFLDNLGGSYMYITGVNELPLIDQSRMDNPDNNVYKEYSIDTYLGLDRLESVAVKRSKK